MFVNFTGWPSPGNVGFPTVPSKAFLLFPRFTLCTDHIFFSFPFNFGCLEKFADKQFLSFFFLIERWITQLCTIHNHIILPISGRIMPDPPRLWRAQEQLRFPLMKMFIIDEFSIYQKIDEFSHSYRFIWVLSNPHAFLLIFHSSSFKSPFLPVQKKKVPFFSFSFIIVFGIEIEISFFDE